MSGIKIITKNKRAYFDFQIKETFEAGLMLQGTEIKSLRLGKAQINEAYVMIDKNFEVWLYNMSIPQYEFGNRHNHEETRKRKLLLNKIEIKKLFDKMKQEALTIVPTKLYFKKSYAKIEIGLAKGKKLHDKREASKEKSIEKKLRQGNYDI